MREECQHPPCSDTPYRAGYCSLHYRRKLKGRDMDMPRLGSETPQALFWRKVNKTEGCWVWTARRDKKGYGTFGVNRKMQLAHRVAFAWSYGDIPPGKQIDHMCHNRACVNPDHLRLATPAENAQNLSGARSNNPTGIRGVYWDKRDKAWRADATLNGKRRYLGLYKNISDAEAAVTAWRREHMPYSIMDQERKGAA